MTSPNGNRVNLRKPDRPNAAARDAFTVSRAYAWLLFALATVVGLVMLVMALTSEARAASADRNAGRICWDCLSGYNETQRRAPARSYNRGVIENLESSGHFVVRSNDRNGTVTKRAVVPLEGGGFRESVVTYPMDRPICSHGMGVLKAGRRTC